MPPINAAGYSLLVLLAVLAPSPLPVPLDGIIIGLISAGFNPVLVLILAAAGDIVGTVLIYLIGRKGRDLYAKYRKRKSRPDYLLAEHLLKDHGKYALLFSGVPFLGDALIFLAGFIRMKPGVFYLWFFMGKVLWYGLFLGPVALTSQPLIHYLLKI